MALRLMELGMPRTTVLLGGFGAWLDAGLRTEPKEAPENRPHA